jgi:hypothetical protein
MNRNTWILIGVILASTNLVMMNADAAIANNVFDSKTNDTKQVDAKLVSVQGKRGYSFSFFAQKLCAAEGETCVKVWGSGYFSPDRDSITGRGSYERIDAEKGLVRGTWNAVNLISGSATEVSFVARYVKGDIGAILEAGDATNSAKMCVYGKIVGITSADEAICGTGVTVKIK